MGCCCSCLEHEDGSSNGRVGGSSAGETEMRSVSVQGGGPLSVNRSMSAPSIDVESGNIVSGHGLALIGSTLEQDAAYWEAQIEIKNDGPSVDVSFGVATRKDRKFYEDGHTRDSDAPASRGLDLMAKIGVKNGDTVGIAAQQSDLPMLQFLLNGEPLHDKAVNRFRGSVYPSVFLPENDGLTVKIVFNESEFKELAPTARFGPFIVARGLI